MIQPFNSPEYYAQRGQFLLDVAGRKLNHISEIRATFSPPEVGWIDMSIYVDGVKAVSINWSDVYDPSENASSEIPRDGRPKAGRSRLF